MKLCTRVNNASTSVITAPAPTSTHIGAFCGFFKISVDTNAWASVFQVRQGGGGEGDQLSCGATGTDLLWVDYPTSAELAIATLEVGRWYFVAGNRGSTTIEIFLGTPGSPGWITRVAAADAGTFTPTTLSWGVWNGSGTGDTMDGCHAGWRYWVGRSLSSKQFRREMHSLDALDRAGLWGAWRLAGTADIRDRSPRNNHATLGAGTITTELGPPGVLPRRRNRRGGAVVAAPPPPTGQFWLAAAA